MECKRGRDKRWYPTLWNGACKWDREEKNREEAVQRNSGRLTERRRREWWESDDNQIKQSKVQYFKSESFLPLSQSATPWRREEETGKERRGEERVLTSALTSSTSLACDHTALFSYSHWTTEKKGKQWAGGKWSGQSGMLCRGRVRERESERERERAPAKQEGEGERRGGRRGRRWERDHLFLWRKLANWLRRMKERVEEKREKRRRRRKKYLNN